MVERIENHFMNKYTQSCGNHSRGFKSKYDNEFLLHQKMKRYYLKNTRGYECKQRSLERLRERSAFIQDTKGEQVPFVYQSNAEAFDKVINKELAAENAEFIRLYGRNKKNDSNYDSDDEIIHLCRSRKDCCCYAWI
jgi:hypothetical protein